MRIAIIDHLGTEESYQSAYFELADKYGNDIKLFVPDRWGEYVNNVIKPRKEKNFQVIPVKTFFRDKVNRLLLVIPIIKLMKYNPDILFVNTEVENLLALECTLIKLLFVPKAKLVLVSWRNINYDIQRYPYKFGFIYSLVERYTINKIDHLLAFNKSAKHIFNSKNINNVTYIPMGVNTNLFKRKKYNNGEYFTVGYVGRFEEAKGIHLLLQALTFLDKRIRCILLGKGPLKGYYKRLALELDISDRVNIVQGVEHTKVPEIMNEFDALILPSISTQKWIEQFGRVLIEAMAMGIPVIGSTSGEIPNVIEDAGMVFKENSIEELTRCIKELSENKDLYWLYSQKGELRARDIYSWKNIIFQWNELFTSLLK